MSKINEELVPFYFIFIKQSAKQRKMEKRKINYDSLLWNNDSDRNSKYSAKVQCLLVVANHLKRNRNFSQSP